MLGSPNRIRSGRSPTLSMESGLRLYLSYSREHINVLLQDPCPFWLPEPLAVTHVGQFPEGGGWIRARVGGLTVRFPYLKASSQVSTQWEPTRGLPNASTQTLTKFTAGLSVNNYSKTCVVLAYLQHYFCMYVRTYVRTCVWVRVFVCAYVYLCIYVLM